MVKIIFLQVLLASFISATHAENILYRWKDSSGKYVISDSISAQQEKIGYEIINAKGKVINKVSRAKTPEELQQERQRERKLVRQEEQKEERKRRDRHLLSIYTSEQDILNRRDKRISTIDQLITIHRENIKTNQIQLNKFQKHIDNHTKKNRKIPPQLTENFKSAKSNIREGKNIINTKKQERSKIMREFDYTVNRYRLLVRSPH